MDCRVILPANKEFECGHFFWIAPVSDNEIDDVLITIKESCGVRSCRRAKVRSNSTCMKCGDDVCHNMSASNIVFDLLYNFLEIVRWGGTIEVFLTGSRGCGHRFGRHCVPWRR